MKKICTLLFLLITVNLGRAQITNGNFENWTTVGSYETPDGWDNLNATTNVASVYTCEKGGTAGAYYLKLTTKNVLGLGNVPGVAVYGVIDVAAFKAKSGYPFTGRPQSLTGKWQYVPQGTDQGVIGIYLTKWNATTMKRDTVAHNTYLLPGTVMTWANFSIPLNYLKNFAPDSVIIGASSSAFSSVAGSYLYLDSLAFAGNVPVGISQAKPNRYSIQTYPNPVSGNLSVDFGQVITENLRLQMVDMLGRTAKEVTYNSGQQVYNLNTADMPKGIYYLKAKTGDEMQVFKIIVQ